MSNKYKDIYKMLDSEKKSEFLLWATATFGNRATSIENHWIGKGAVPKDKEEKVYQKLTELSQ